MKRKVITVSAELHGQLKSMAKRDGRLLEAVTADLLRTALALKQAGVPMHSAPQEPRP